MKDSEFDLNTYSKRETKNKEDSSNGQKCIIIIAIIAILIIVTGLVVLFYFLLSDSEDTHTELLCKINCQYLIIKNISQETPLLGENFEKLSSVEVYIDEVKITPSKKYKFDSEGEHNVTFEVYEDLKMDYIYQNILALKSINMTSDKEAKITSMKSNFENCENIEKITIIGFKTS